MKKFTKLITAALSALSLTIISFEWVGARAPAYAQSVITPLSFIKNSDLSFGNLLVGPYLTGKIILTPAGKLINCCNGVVTVPSPTAVASADFTVTGEPEYIYAVSLPSTAIVSNGANIMSLSGFTSYPTGNGLLDSNGVQKLKIGATLNIPAAHAAGHYFNLKEVQVTINYN